MARRLFQFVAFLVLIFATLTPLANCFDTWDKNQPPANDTELQLTAFYVIAGFALVLPKLVRHFFIPPVRLQQTTPPTRPVFALSCSDWYSPDPTSSPPLVPLRI